MMQQYRAYLVGENGVFRSAEAFEALSDEKALAFARQFTRQGNVEVWQLGRKIGLLKQAGQFPISRPGSKNGICSLAIDQAERLTNGAACNHGPPASKDTGPAAR